MQCFSVSWSVSSLACDCLTTTTMSAVPAVILVTLIHASSLNMCKQKTHYPFLVPHAVCSSQVPLLQLCKCVTSQLSACEPAGAVVAAATDLTFSLYGYIAVVINNFLTALYLIMVKNSPATSGLTTTGLLGYNAALSLPLLTAALALSNEPRRISLYPGFRWRGYQVSNLSCLV